MPSAPSTRFARFAWLVLAVALLVVLWGAYVRASGSGAGCGSHWPLCNGQVVPRAPRMETLVEFTHRLTSGLAFLLVVALVVGARRAFPRGHLTRRGAVLALFFILTEALVGAGLVLLELVAHNQSLARAIWMAAHLVNTFLLLGAIALTAWWAAPETDGRGAPSMRGHRLVAGTLGVGALAMLVLGVSGALTALGDTLFPARTLAEGFRQDFSPTAHFLIRLRFLHPTLAIGVGTYLVATALIVALRRPGRTTRRLATTLVGLFVAQIGAGILNLVLLAPVGMQLVHLLLADLVWITLVLLGAAALAAPAAARVVHPQGAGEPRGYAPATGQG
jgi:heme A synthase